MWVIGNSNGVVMIDQSETKIEWLVLGSKIGVGRSLESGVSDVS